MIQTFWRYDKYNHQPLTAVRAEDEHEAFQRMLHEMDVCPCVITPSTMNPGEMRVKLVNGYWKTFEGENTMSIEIKYNETDGFDLKHYPLEQWHREAIEQINSLFGLNAKQEWFYHATIHGRIFFCKAGESRLVADDLKQLAEINGFRWIEASDGKLSIGLEHKLHTA